MIKAECVAASKCQTKIATFKVTMPRYILAEFNTHRLFSRNSASSRAIRTEKMLKSIADDPFIPIAWQKDHTGMQGFEYFKEEMFGNNNPIPIVQAFKLHWTNQAQESLIGAGIFNKMGLTKQITNRLLEPFMWHTVLVTATEWNNFFELRCPKYQLIMPINQVRQFKSKRELLAYMKVQNLTDENEKLMSEWTDLDWLKINKGQADIHIMAVAEAIYDAWNEADFKELAPGEWHLPYGDQINLSELTEALYKLSGERVLIHNDDLMQAVREICVARCARLSYQTLGDNPKVDYLSDLKLYNNLKQNGHWSPFEHIAYAMDSETWDTCIKTIVNKDSHFQYEYGWLANFRGWVQQRAILENQSNG